MDFFLQQGEHGQPVEHRHAHVEQEQIDVLGVQGFEHQGRIGQAGQVAVAGFTEQGFEQADIAGLVVVYGDDAGSEELLGIETVNMLSCDASVLQDARQLARVDRKRGPVIGPGVGGLFFCATSASLGQRNEGRAGAFRRHAFVECSQGRWREQGWLGNRPGPGCSGRWRRRQQVAGGYCRACGRSVRACPSFACRGRRQSASCPSRGRPWYGRTRRALSPRSCAGGGGLLWCNIGGGQFNPETACLRPAGWRSRCCRSSTRPGGG